MCPSYIMRQIASADNLHDAWNRVRANGGAPGVDHVSVQMFAARYERYLDDLRGRLLKGTYFPVPARRFSVPKQGGGERVLAVPAVMDRVAQRAFVNVLSPRLEAVFLDCSFGYRPGRSVPQAIQRLRAHRGAGALWTFEADIRRCFDTLDHRLLLTRLRELLPDPAALDIVALWLEAGALTEPPLHEFALPEDGLLRRIAQWLGVVEADALGVAQGSPLSPLLANFYLHPLDHALTRHGLRMVRYADDFVVCCRSQEEARQAWQLTQAALRPLRLALHPDKTRVALPGETFDFLGWRFHRHGARPLRPARPEAAS